jgi:hypothetical protein
MNSEAVSWRPRRKWRRHRYYKVQHFEDRSLTWRDFKQAFDDLSAARQFITDNCSGMRTRIVWVEGKGRGALEQHDK